MYTFARKIASDASFQVFTNCYLREVDQGVWHTNLEWKKRTGLVFDQGEKYVLELQLADSETTLAIGVTFRSLVGRHQLTKVYQQKNNQMYWQTINQFEVVILLIKNIYSTHSADITHNNMASEQQLELMTRTIESQQVMANYIALRAQKPSINQLGFIQSEQSLVFGHWLHPTPKSRQGMHTWQHQYYSPELAGHFQLHFFAVERHLVTQNSAIEQVIIKHVTDHTTHGITSRTKKSAEQVIQSLLANEKAFPKIHKNQVLIPVHPLQGQWLLHQGYVKKLIAQGELTDLGLLGPKFTPTSSVRTLYCASLDYMLKLSIPVKITNSLRLNMQHELNVGVLLAKLMLKLGFSDDHPQFQIIQDPASISISLPGLKESGFEVIIRDNPFKVSASQADIQNVQSIAALVQAAIYPTGRSSLANIIHTCSKTDNISLQQASLKWFDAYWHCAIELAIRLYDNHGIALEAHQQNSLLDVSQGYPSQFYYRDNQGYYLSKSKRGSIVNLVPDLDVHKELFYPDDMIIDRFGYYLIINQLFSVINRLALDGLVAEHILLGIAQEKLRSLAQDLNQLGNNFIQALLQKPELACKGNLLTRINDVDELQAELELAVYTKIKNPLCMQSTQVAPNQSHLNEKEKQLVSV
ncbi:MAG: siderophore synthetase component [Paraglaciecola sp.]